MERAFTGPRLGFGSAIFLVPFKARLSQYCTVHVLCVKSVDVIKILFGDIISPKAFDEFVGQLRSGNTRRDYI